MRVKIWQLRALTLFFAVLFLVSAFMSSTYAWQSEQEALNNFYSNKTVMVPVELVKLEKQTDQTDVEIPIANTVFYLFRENGAQIEGRHVTDENGRINLLLNAGRYYFEEVSPGIGYTYDTDQNGDSVTRYYFTVTDQDTKITVKAYNTRLNGDLLIRKTVENINGAPLTETQRNTPFTFTVSFSDGGSYAYRIDNGEEQTMTSGGTLKLCSGQTAVFDELPVGVLYDVVETPVEGYVSGGTGHRGNITDTQSVADFVNRCDQSKLGSLVVSKEVRGDGANLSKEFTFTATLGDMTETFTLKHGETKAFVGLPLGISYTVTEQDASSEGYTATVDTYIGHITGSEMITLPFVNIHNETPPTDKTGSLTVSKKVIGANDPKKLFGFEVVFTGANAPENISFTLPEDKEYTIDNIPHGVEFTVFETDASGYWPVLEQASGTIVGDQEASIVFTNRVPTEETGSIIVSKEVAGEYADLSRTYAFTVDINGKRQTFVLHHGESKVFAGLPVGTEYTVTESDISGTGYIATVREYKGQVVGTENITLPFVNVYDLYPSGKYGSLTVNKKVIGSNADPDREFTFTVVFEGEDAPESETFTLKSGGSKIFENIPYGVTYTVVETDSAGYDAALTNVSGAIAGNQNAVVTFTNKAPEKPDETTKLTVKKLLAGDFLESDKQREFNMKLTVDGKTTLFTLKADEVREFDIPVGAVYEVSEENYISDSFSQFTVNGLGTATSEPIEVVVTNTYVGTTKVEISGEKIWNMNGHDDVELPEYITVQLKNGDLLIEEKTVRPDENGLWKYSFIAPKYNADGSVAVYTLYEPPITSYRVSYDGYNIINTYVKPIEVVPPAITKVVAGDQAPTSSFEFAFTGMHGTPMPEGSEGYRKTLTLNGAGELEIGSIVFTDPGEYVYSVHEKNVGAKGWEYDTALYTVTVKVTEKDYLLTAEYTITKNNVVTDKLVFTNTFRSEIDENVIVSGIKTWDHGNNPEKNRPTYIIVLVYGNDFLVAQRKITADDNWQYSFELPRFDQDGKEIVYVVDEVEVEDYSKRIDGYDIINTYIGTPDNPDSPAKPPQTGDSTDLIFWLALMLFSLIGLIVTIMLSRKKYAYVGRHYK